MIILILAMGKIEVQIGKPRSHHQLVMELQMHGPYGMDPFLPLIFRILHCFSLSCCYTLCLLLGGPRPYLPPTRARSMA